MNETKPKTWTQEYDERTLRRTLDGISPANRSVVERYIEDKKLQDRALRTLCHNGRTLAALDRFLNGAPLLGAPAESLRAFLLQLGTRNTTRTLQQASANLKGFFRWHDPNERLPDGYGRALRVSARNVVNHVRVLAESERDALLAAAESVRDQAMIWTLWDSGFRIGELLSLRLDSVEPDGKGGAQLRLPADAYGLKTGPRSVYVVDCMASLSAWTGAHPLTGQAGAPLFPSYRDGNRAMIREAAYMALARISKRAGIRQVWPHLFRHTRATRAAKAGWNEEQMRNYFGWAPGSPMPSVYVHLAQADMEERVRRDAGIDGNGQRLTNPAVDATILDDRVRDALRRLLAGETSSQQDPRVR